MPNRTWQMIIGSIMIGLMAFGLFLLSCSRDWCSLSEFYTEPAIPVGTYSSSAGAESSTSVMPFESNIHVSTPKVGDSVTDPMTVKGEARVFENQFNFLLRDFNGSVLVEGTGYANGEMGSFGPFQLTVLFPRPKGTSGVLEVFDYSPKDGSVIDLVKVPIHFAP